MKGDWKMNLCTFTWLVSEQHIVGVLVKVSSSKPVHALIKQYAYLQFVIHYSAI